MKCIEMDTDLETVWEFEAEIGHITQVEINPNELNNSNIFAQLDLIEAMCVCK